MTKAPSPMTKTIRQRVEIPAPPAAVFDAFVKPRLHAKFTGSPATGSGRVGGRMTAWDGYISAKNLELVRGKRIVQEWHTTEWPEGSPPSLLTLTLTPKGKHTELTMIHSEVPASQAADYRRGWQDYYWKPLKTYFRAL
jgi:uncharacterized protein YndB with AHSA1/START domain